MLKSCEPRPQYPYYTRLDNQTSTGINKIAWSDFNSVITVIYGN